MTQVQIAGYSEVDDTRSFYIHHSCSEEGKSENVLLEWYL
jgi:hypothetical protein